MEMKQRRGFAAMSVQKRTEIARKGGASIPNELRSFSKDRSLAASAGSKGGKTSKRKRWAKLEPIPG